MSDDWLDEIRQLREADHTARQQSEQQAQEETDAREAMAVNLLRQTRAHELLRQVQKALLNGQGALDIFDRAGDYDRAITLTWQGHISEARRPDHNDPSPMYYIAVGVRDDKLWVNDQPLPTNTTAVLKKALLAASRNPGKQTGAPQKR